MAKAQDRSRGAAGAHSDLPFSRPFTVEELLRRPDEPVKIAATPDELTAVARADGLPSVASLSAEFKVNRQGKDIRVAGEVRARVTQECVVTLEPFESDVIEPVDVRFAFAPPPPPPAPREGERLSRRRASQAQQEHRSQPVPEHFPSHEEDDPPDPIVDGKIDLGALAAEFMALGLDPYPRKPGVEFAAVQEDATRDESPFAGLAPLRKED